VIDKCQTKFHNSPPVSRGRYTLKTIFGLEN
jgi:hypothetical protein